MRIIYADILLIINLAVDYLVLFGTARLSGTEFVRLKGLLAAVFGAVYSLCVIFPISDTALWISRIAVSAVMIFICFGKRRFTEFLRLLVIFYICSFVFSGFMLIIGIATQPEAFMLKNGVVYFNLSAWEIIIAACAAFAVTELLRRFFRRGEAEGNCIARVYHGGKCAVINGFVDTGNSLTEPISGIPVAVCRLEDIGRIFDEEMLFAIKEKSLSTEHGIRLVPCSTVSGSVLIPAIRPQRLVAEMNGAELEAEEVMIGFSEFAPKGTLLLGKNIIFKKADKSFTEVR